MKPQGVWGYQSRPSMESSPQFCTEPKSEFHQSRLVTAAMTAAHCLGTTIIPGATGNSALAVMNNLLVATVKKIRVNR